MRNFLKKILFFLVPFFVYGTIVLAVDPYNYFDFFHVVSDAIKENTSARLNSHLWKIIDFRRAPSPNVILGDSRSNRIDTNDVERVTGEKYYNFAYGGGSLTDIIETFWYAAELVDLKNVYIGINFNLYNGIDEMNDNVSQAEEISSTPLKYIFSRTTFSALCSNVYSLVSGKSIKIGEPRMTHDKFWEYQINTTAKRFYQKYQYPKKNEKGLESIAQYCDQRGIKLYFFLPPCHYDLQRSIVKFGLTAENERFLSDLQRISAVIDLDYCTSFTTDKDNFDDPFHFKYDKSSLVVSEIWGRKKDFSRRFEKGKEDN